MSLNRFHLSEISPNEDSDISKVQLLRAGKYKYDESTNLEITADTLRTMKKNFDDKVLKIDCAIDYCHNAYQEAAGWIKEVILKANDKELWVKVEWTDTAEEKILSKEFRYLSVDFEPNYKDNETGKEFGTTLRGGGLTNRPFVKGMNPILSEISAMIDKSPEKMDDIRRILSDNPKQGTFTMDFAELKKALVSVQLSDENKKEIARLIGFESNDVKLSDQLSAIKVTLTAKEAEIVRLSDENKALKKEQEFAVLLSEGKAVPAQKDAYLKNDMAEFVKQSVAVNLSAAGTGSPATVTADVKTRQEAEEKIIQLTDAKQKLNPTMAYQDVVSLVMSENPALKKLLA